MRPAKESSRSKEVDLSDVSNESSAWMPCDKEKELYPESAAIFSVVMIESAAPKLRRYFAVWVRASLGSLLGTGVCLRERRRSVACIKCDLSTTFHVEEVDSALWLKSSRDGR